MRNTFMFSIQLHVEYHSIILYTNLQLTCVVPQYREALHEKHGRWDIDP
jgi:hypothetical protein